MLDNKIAKNSETVDAPLPVLHGQDIADGTISSHELARKLLAGPNLKVLIPCENEVDNEAYFASIGRITHDDRWVYLSSYYLENADLSGHFEISDEYEHAEQGEENEM